MEEAQIQCDNGATSCCLLLDYGDEILDNLGQEDENDWEDWGFEPG